MGPTLPADYDRPWMGLMAAGRRAALALATIVAAPLILASAGSGAAPLRKCPSFGSQAAAQAYFMHLGGTPSKRVGNLDPDHDGVACEELAGPYQGFATIGYNQKRHFLYGV